MVPWLPSQISTLEQAAGGDYWPYGISENRNTLETFLRYFHEQGLSSRRLSVEDLFAPETFEDAKI
jgi:4,5-dihydroxyphthalate decarboxylase